MYVKKLRRRWSLDVLDRSGVWTTIYRSASERGCEECVARAKIFKWSSAQKDLCFRVYDRHGRLIRCGEMDEKQLHPVRKVPMIRWTDGDMKLRSGEAWVPRVRETLDSEVSTKKFVKAGGIPWVGKKRVYE